MDLKKNNIVAITAIVVVVGITSGIIGFLFAKKVEAPANEAYIPVVQVSTPSIDQSGQDLSSVVSETVTRNEYATRLPHIDCATWSVSNDALLQAKPIVMGTYDIYEMPSCMVVVDTRGQRYATFGFRDFVHKSAFFKQVIGTSQSNLGYNVQVNESGLVVLKLWKLKADCSKYRNDAMCSNDETTFTQPLPWNASDTEWAKIGSVVETTSIDTFNPIPSIPSLAQEALSTTGWQTYSDTKNGIAFKYPVDWEVKPTVASDMGGTWLAITPKVVNAENQYLKFLVAIFRSNIASGATTGVKDDAETWYRNNLAGGPSTEQKRSERNGASVFFSKDVYDASTNDMYVLSNNAGTVIYSNLTEKAYTYTNPKDRFIIDSKTSPKMELEYSNSEYVPIYEALIDSIVFTKK